MPAMTQKKKAKKTKAGKADALMDEDALFESAMSGSFDFSSIKEGETYHAPDALDFEDEDELAEDELPEETAPSIALPEPVSLGAADGPGTAGADDADDDLMDELEQEGLAVEMEDDPFGHRADQFKEEMQLRDVTDQVGESDLEEMSESEDVAEAGRAAAADAAAAAEAAQLDAQRARVRAAAKQKRREDKLLRNFFPDFKPGVVMKMIPTFSSTDYADYSWHRPRLPGSPLIPTKVQFEVDVDERKLFCRPVAKNAFWKQPQQAAGSSSSGQKDHGRSAKGQQVVRITDDDLRTLVPARPVPTYRKPQIQDFDGDMVLATCDWDDDAILGAGGADGAVPVTAPAASAEPRATKRFKIDPHSVDDWIDDDDIFEGQINLQSLNLKLDTNDPHILFFDQRDSSSHKPADGVALSVDSRFDISNDKAYEMLRANYHSKVRSTIGNLSIEHSLPAARLQYPFYRIKLEPRQARMLHRPQLRVRPNAVWVFTKVKKRKSKKDKGKPVQEIFAKSTDLTLGDSANFFLMEYTEEYPLVLSNFGMASKLINYYRKRNDEDTTRPRLLVGETHVLGVQDKSPFWNFGFVEPGNVVPTLYNRMVRAPIFKQEAKETDFLLVRSHGGNGSGSSGSSSSGAARCYLRPISHVFTVGQQFPAVEIPGPHSRKVTSTSKNRLKMVVYRILNKNEHHRLSVRDISAHFPDQNDMQNRQRLKEFMEYQRSGEDQGFWKVKQGEMLPNYDQIRNMITPEDISLLESMCNGDQYLNDITYYYGDEEELERAKLKSKEKTNNNNKNIGEETVEEQLAPWNITRNFLNAVQGKAMLQIHGEGDPSGRGEAFSFLRTSMKGGFRSSNDDDGSVATPGTPSTPQPVKTEKKRGRKKDEEKAKLNGPSHRYNVAMQQKAYEDEIAKVWYTQQRVLADTGADLKEEYSRIEELARSDLADDVAEGSKVHIKSPELAGNVGGNVGAAAATAAGAKTGRKLLKITRMVRDANGILQRKSEIVRDPAVIKAYIEKKIKQQVTSIDGNFASEALGPTADPEQNERMKKALLEEIEKLEKSKERRKKKGPHKKRADDGPLGDDAPAVKKSTNRKCKRCGSTGHISTNKKLCPMYRSDGAADGSSAPTPVP